MADFPLARQLSSEEVDYFVNNFDHHDRRFGQDPMPVYDKMVRECPIKFSPNYGGFWVFTGFDEAHWGWRNYELLATAPSTNVPPGFGAKRPMLPVEVDPPEHNKYRSLLTPVFAPARVKELESEIREICTELIDAFIDRGECEFVHELAQPLPARVFVKMLGIPLEETADFIAWNNVIMHGLTDDPSGATRVVAGNAVRERLASILEMRKASRGNDIISRLVDAEVGGERLDDEHLLDIAYMLFLAGLDTVQGAMSFHYAFLATHPDHRDRLVKEPSIIPNATDELLRWDGVVVSARNVTRDFEYKGHEFKKGQQVIMINRSSNRDPKVFDNPQVVDFDRPPGRHLTFATGPHRCIGSHLALLELQIVHEEMHRRIPHYRLKEGTVVRSHGGSVAGLDELWLEWPT